MQGQCDICRAWIYENCAGLTKDDTVQYFCHTFLMSAVFLLMADKDPLLILFVKIVKYLNYITVNSEVHVSYTDLKKAFESVPKIKIWKTLQKWECLET